MNKTQHIVIACFTLLAVAGIAFFIYTNHFLNRENQVVEIVTTPIVTQTKTPSPSLTSTPSVTRSATDESSLRNGTYTATGAYQTPETNEQVTVTLTLENEIITSINTSTTSEERESRQYLQLFAAGIANVVVGKKITEVTPIGRVNGSSLTGDGFDKAIREIIQQAT